LELHRLNDPKTNVEAELVAELARNDFPHAERFVSCALEQGTLMLLLDGLDEVSSNERTRVVQHIKDTLDQHKKCRAVVTCRTAVYRGEFNEAVNQTIEIVEFNDQQTRRFLGSWEPDMKKRAKSIEQLIQTLRDRPRIMALARNPLLLTIIAYLYTDTEFVLPHSRTEFYRKSTDILLDLWHQEHNRFKASDKRLVLQYLALFNQDSAARHGQDRRTMERPVVLEQVRKVLPGLNLPPEDAGPVLDEIVERSGLLLAIDAGERYQFAHLTLQEYFAATELMDDAQGLFGRFKADRDAWRETIKLWCGLDHDSTNLIRAIYAEDQLTAFECLADAQKVEPVQANEILDAFKSRLGEVGNEEVIARAFGAVASDLRPRGTSIFKFLEEALSDTQDVKRHEVAAHALSFTNLPQAAQVLTDYYVRARAAGHPEVPVPLLSMGDLAVLALAPLARAGSVEAMDNLQYIGTSQATEALIPLLWHADKNISGNAAWRLAALLDKPGIEDALRDYPLTPQQRKADWLEWIWEPFRDSTNSALPIIAGRVAYVIEQAPAATVPRKPQLLDSRLALPLLVENSERYMGRLDIKQREHMQEEAKHIMLSKSGYTEFMDRTLNIVQAEAKWRHLLTGLPTEMQLDLLRRLMREGPSPTRDDWRNIFRPVKYAFETGWHYGVVIAIVACASLIAIGQIVVTLWRAPMLFHWSNGLLSAMMIAVLWNWFIFWRGWEGEKIPVGKPIHSLATWTKNMLEPRDPDTFISFLLGPVMFPAFVFFELFDVIRDEKTRVDIRSIAAYLPILGFSPVVGYFTTTFLLDVFPRSLVVIFWLTAIGTGVMLWLVGRKRERDARNPLQGILEPQTSSLPRAYRANRGRFRLWELRR